MDNLLAQQSADPADSNVDSSIPNYLLAADSHNIGNTLGGSWFDPDTWSTKFSNAGKFVATAALSGADSLYNSAATVGSWAGIGDGAHDTGDWISSIDDNLGQYYAQNRQAVDLAGFVATSFIPGLGGVKFLNAGQTMLKGAMRAGTIGENLARATGLLVPETQAYVRLAAKDIASSSGAISLINGNTLKALGSGVYQNVLESAAFETAVQATMFKSPILDQQDGWDIAKNIAFGGLVGGAFGGAFEAARSVGGIKKLASDELTTSKPFSSRFISADAAPADQQMILTAEARDARAVPVNIQNDAYPLGDSNAPANTKLYNSSIEKDNNAIRGNINSLVKGTDGTIGNMTADALHNVPAQDLMETMLHAQEIGTLGSTSKLESAFNKATKSLDLDAIADAGMQNRYVKLVGESSGDVTDAAPLISSIADNVSSSGSKDIESAVSEAVKKYGFKTTTLWDASELAGKAAHTEAEARYIWADGLQSIKPGITIHQNDIPLLERVQTDLKAGTAIDYKVKYSDGSVGDGLNARELAAHLEQVKSDAANDLLTKMVYKGQIPVEYGTESIAKIVNTKQSYLEGTRSPDKLSDLYARQDAQKAYTSDLVSKGLMSASDTAPDISYLPSYAKVSYKTQPLNDINGNVLDGMSWLKAQQQMYQQAADRVFAKNAGSDIFAAAPEIHDSDLINASLSDGGAGLATFHNPGYGTLGSKVAQIGSNVTRPLKEAMRGSTSDAFAAPLVAMGTKQEAVIEWSVINNKIAATTEQYVLDTEGAAGAGNNLIAKKIADYNEAIASGKENVQYPTLQQGADEFIPVRNQETYDAISAHIDRTDARLSTLKEINAIAGKEDNKTLGTFRPIPPNPNDYKFFAFVKDDKVTGAGHTTMIHAQSESELRALTSQVPTDQGYRVVYKDQAEEYYKARNEFEYARTLNENYVDSDLKSRGINSQFFTDTDPQKIVDNILQSHLRADDVTATELVRMKYQPQFDWLEDQGKQFSQVESSQYGNALSKVEKYGKNPYTDYTKTALDVSKASEYGLLYSANRALDSAVSNVYDKISSVWDTAKTPAEMDSINSILESHGINSAYSNAASDALINHTAPKAVLSKFIRTSNGILSKFILALDPMNGLNNAIGANILRSTELKQLTDAINSGDTSLAGALGNVAKIGVPGVPDASLVSPTKLLANAVRNFVQDDGTLMAKYQSEGLVKDSLNQFRSIMDDFSLKGTESVGDLNGRLNSAFQSAKSLGATVLQKGEVYSGNKFFEQMNRFLSANVMNQLTDLGENAGLMSDAESRAYRNTFVNRVEGNTVASQRPVMFQGPIGQAVGLFQSYQFNLMQQMFRYVSEGSGKDAAMLLGLQGTMYGINGLPAFNAINTHIVGNLSGNTNHTDLYDATYGIAGKTAGDFLMYGIPSSITQTNLYSRGDINPRSLTIIPSQISDIPVVSAYSKLFGSLYNTVSKVANGGNLWESILQGAEHNGISRPLAGLAQDLQATTGNGIVFSTSNAGSILGTNDFMSFASLSRLAGGRPLDEAIVNDGTYRIQAYEASQKVQRDKLIAAVKSTGIEGQTADIDSLNKFTSEYAASGGKQADFNKFMMNEYKSANTSQAQKILTQLQNPFNQKMQILMGGRNENGSVANGNLSDLSASGNGNGNQ